MQNISAAVHLGQTPDVDNKNSVAAHLTLKVVHTHLGPNHVWVSQYWNKVLPTTLYPLIQYY